MTHDQQARADVTANICNTENTKIKEYKSYQRNRGEDLRGGCTETVHSKDESAKLLQKRVVQGALAVIRMECGQRPESEQVTHFHSNKTKQNPYFYNFYLCLHVFLCVSATYRWHLEKDACWPSWSSKSLFWESNLGPWRNSKRSSPRRHLSSPTFPL